MAKEPSPQEQNAAAKPAESPKKSSPLKLVLLIGIPAFIIQLVVVYFVAAKFVAPAPAAEAKAVEAKEHADTEGAAQSIFLVKDIIVNPAGTNGTRFLLTTIGIEVASQDAQTELEKNEVQIRDALITILANKGLPELATNENREVLRREIAAKVGTLVRSGKLRNVYFSKFIIQ